MNEQKPSEQPCPKCGSTDVLRRFRARNAVWVPDDEREQDGKYRGFDGRRVYATREHIDHHCRTCQHMWQGLPIPKDEAEGSGNTVSQVANFNGTPFPLRIPALRRACARADRCPECGGELDTGWECNACGYDARDEAYPPDQRERDERMDRP